MVNDNPEFLELVHDILESERFTTTVVDIDQGDVVGAVRASRPDVLMIDLRMGSEEMRGWSIAQQVRADPRYERLPVLVCSADVVALDAIADEIGAARDVAALAKPFAIDDLTAAIDRLLADGSES